MTNQVPELVQAANQAANSGRFQDAERLWQEVRKLEPRHPKALFSLGFHALQRGDVGGALDFLRSAREAAPQDMVLLMTLAAAHKQRGDTAEELEAIDAALAVDAYFLPGMLAKASWIERHGNRVAAARMYANCLKVAPPEPQWPQQMRSHLAYAKGYSERYKSDYHGYLTQHLAEQQARLPRELANRWDEAISIMSGRTKPFHQDCNQLHVPRLPPIPFPDRRQFPWLSAIEEKTDVIRAELLAALEADRDKFDPYIQYAPGDPVNQWAELNHSLRWSVLKLWAGGQPDPVNIELAPRPRRRSQRFRLWTSRACARTRCSRRSRRTRASRRITARRTRASSRTCR